MSAVIFSGDRVKALKKAFRLSDKATIFSDSVDPSSVATAGNAGDLFISTSTNKLYIKQDSGSSTNWDLAGEATDLTSGSVPFVNGSGKLVDDNTNLNFNDGTNTLTAHNLSVPGTTTLNTGFTGVTKLTAGLVSVSNVNLTSEVTGTLPTGNGGTGLNTLGVAGQLLGVAVGGAALEYKTLSGTANQIISTTGAGSIVLSTPQNIATTSSPTFGGLTINGNASVTGTTTLSTALTGFLKGTSGVVSSQSQIVLTTDVTGILPVANGGTNSSTSLNNNRIMISSTGSIVEASALTNGQLLIGQTGGAPVAASISGGSGITVTNGAGTIAISDNSFNTGDINPTSFSGANNQVAAANVTGFAFSNATVRGFRALVTITVDATADLFETMTILGVQKGTLWEMNEISAGDNSLVDFTITTAGQIQYTSGNYSGFSSLTIKFSAVTLGV